MSVKRIAVSMLFSLLAVGSPVAYATQVQAGVNQESQSVEMLGQNENNEADNQYQNGQMASGVNENCPNDGVRALDGTGYQGGNGQKSEACVNENCPNDGVRALDGTGYQGGNGQKSEACVNENCPNDGVRVLDGTGYKRQVGQK